jgi:hypothetical protein
MSINCVEVDCKSLESCPPCSEPNPYEEKFYHFEIPQVVNDFASDAIEYIGSTDKKTRFKVYTDVNSFKYHKYLRRGANKPYVYIETTPNENNMYNG